MQFAHALTLRLSILYTKHYVELLPPDNKHSVVKVLSVGQGTGSLLYLLCVALCAVLARTLAAGLGLGRFPLWGRSWGSPGAPRQA